MDNADRQRMDDIGAAALVASVLQPALWRLLIDKGIVSAAEFDGIIDGGLLRLEQSRALHDQDTHGAGAIDGARLQLEAIRKSLGLPG